ncbi:SMI1/KNR4 family protein [Limibacter armeniacum]|uniref:SMI1/KNR4 family protein n=1 Tax=Limibacter armeniacum TaxID=466084 RepID=UPI002FE50A80
MIEIWNKLYTWLEQHVPHLADELNEGAGVQSFKKLEDAIGKSLPEDFKAFYSIHDGQALDEDTGSAEGLIDGDILLPLEEVFVQWTAWKTLLEEGQFDQMVSTPDKGIKNAWWNPLWIPFTHDDNGNHICLDLDPDDSGAVGQVIMTWHDATERVLVASSFSEFIAEYVEGLENGLYVYSEEWSGIINKEEAEDF